MRARRVSRSVELRGVVVEDEGGEGGGEKEGLRGREVVEGGACCRWRRVEVELEPGDISGGRSGMWVRPLVGDGGGKDGILERQ